MPDPVTHMAVAWLVRSPWRTRMAPVFLAGAVVPDLSHLPPMALSMLQRAGAPIPPQAIYFWAPMHLPVGILLTGLLITFLFAADLRFAVFRNLLAGGALHVTLDLLQCHMGIGYPVFFPFSTLTVEVGLLPTEATVPLAPGLAILAILVEVRHHLRARRTQVP